MPRTSMTLTEKILAGKAGKDAVKPGEIVSIEPDLLMTHDHQGPMAVREFRSMGIEHIRLPEKTVIAFDHRTPSQTEVSAANHYLLRQFIKEQNIGHFFDVGQGICHDVVADSGLALPGSAVIATDSHTVIQGAFGAFGTGIGSSEMASIWASGSIWFRVPETYKIILKGKPASWIGGKDIALHLLKMLTTDGATYKALEFHGDGVGHLNMDERMTLCCMSLEMGAKNAIFPVDRITLDYLAERGVQVGAESVVEPDPDAEYARVIEIDLEAMEPLAAEPYSPDNVRTLREIAKENIHIDQAIVGTCAGGRMADLRWAAEILKGRSVAPGVRFLIVPATRTAMLKCLEEGLADIFVKAGAMLNVPACGPCGAYGMGAMADEEACITTGSRNFFGRLGGPRARIYLGNAASVAAAAVAGKLIDPRDIEQEGGLS